MEGLTTSEDHPSAVFWGFFFEVAGGVGCWGVCVVQQWKIAMSPERWPAYVVCSPFNLALSHSHLSDHCLGVYMSLQLCGFVEVHMYESLCVRVFMLDFIFPFFLFCLRRKTIFLNPCQHPKAIQIKLKFFIIQSFSLSLTHTSDLNIGCLTVYGDCINE